MGEYARSDEVILLFERYSLSSQRLHTSFKQSGCDYTVVVIEEDGFLPEDVMSVYGYFMGNGRETWENAGGQEEIHEIMIPGGQEKAINGETDRYIECGKIFYTGLVRKRRIKTVNWYDEKNVICVSDHYNQYGKIYARTRYNVDGKKVKKSWFSFKGQEVITENLVSGKVLLLEDTGEKVFREKLDLVLYFFRKTGFEERRIFYNSLAMPFFVSNRLCASGKRDVLFWQEQVEDEIPWNMQMIQQGKARRTAEVMVLRRTSYERLLELGASEDTVHKLGQVYQFRRKNRHGQDALICTNSENVEHCLEIVNALPEMHFHIAALTLMSPRLMSVGENENVTLYPAAKKDVISELFKKCDFYLDINHKGEIMSAVYRAFLHDHLIFAFEETAHDKDYVAEKRIYPAKDWERMTEDIRVVMRNGKLMDRCLQKQHEAAWAVDGEVYEGMLRVSET